MRIYFILFLLTCMPFATAWAMEDDELYSYTRAELAAGRQQSGAQQTLGLDGWVGYDKRRLWWQADGTRGAGKLDASALGVWYGQYIAPFWDAQIGIRREGNPQNTSYFSVGVRGLSPYQFDTDIKLNIRSDGKPFARARFENEVLLTNRFILRPWLDTAWSGVNADNTVRSGLYQLSAGLQARYEFSRGFAPYLEFSRTLYPQAQAGGNLAQTLWLAGLRFIF